MYLGQDNSFQESQCKGIHEFVAGNKTNKEC